MVFIIIGQDGVTGSSIKSRRIRRSELCWRPPPEGWIKVHMDAFRRQCMKSVTLRYIMRDNRLNVIMVRSK